MALVYYLTAAGKEAARAKDGETDFPLEYRRLLALIEVDGHAQVLRGRMRRDLLLLDVMLPDGNGFDILAQLRAFPEFATLPIVMLTVKAELGDIRKGLALGADGYLTKPYSTNQLAEIIGR